MLPGRCLHGIRGSTVEARGGVIARGRAQVLPCARSRPNWLQGPARPGEPYICESRLECRLQPIAAPSVRPPPQGKPVWMKVQVLGSAAAKPPAVSELRRVAFRCGTPSLCSSDVAVDRVVRRGCAHARCVIPRPDGGQATHSTSTTAAAPKHCALQSRSLLSVQPEPRAAFPWSRPCRAGSAAAWRSAGS